ncbi:MAG: hypothetical protein ACP5VP_03700 [Candidatus Limnocylindrales bacterium]
MTGGLIGPERRLGTRRVELLYGVAVVIVYVAAAGLALHVTHPAPNRMMVLAERLVQGHLDSPSFAGTVDSVARGGRYYVAVGVLQVLPYLPFVYLPALRAVSGYAASLAFGIPAAWLALPLARAYGARGRAATWIAIFTAYGTLLFFVSVLGSLYYLAQAEAFLFLELALLEWAGPRRPTVLGALFGLAFLARPTTVLAVVPVGLVLAWSARHRLRAILQLALPLAVAAVVSGAFNWARFGSPLETGYGISLLTDPALEARRAAGLFSLGQVPENVRLALLQGFGLQPSFPYLTVDPSGLSMLLVSPALVTSLWAGARAPRARLLWAAAILVAVPIFLYYGGGYAQYGFRYSLDFTPFLVALMALGSRRWLGPPERALILLSIASVTFGVLWAAHVLPG